MIANTNTIENMSQAVAVQTRDDLKTALIAVSLLANLVLFTTWLVIQADPNVALVLLSTT